MRDWILGAVAVLFLTLGFLLAFPDDSHAPSAAGSVAATKLRVWLSFSQ